MTLSLVVLPLLLHVSLNDVIARGISCDSGKADDCMALYGEDHCPEGNGSAAECKKGDCTRFNSALAMDAASPELRDLGLKGLTDACRSKTEAACTQLDGAVAEADSRGWGAQQPDTTPETLKSHAALLRDISSLRGPLCTPLDPNDKLCPAILRLPAKAKNLDTAAAHLAKKEPVCDRPLSCAISCASGVPPACAGFKMPDYKGDFAFQLVMGMWAALQGCVGGDVESCTTWFLMVAKPDDDPKQWAGLKPDMISAVSASCAADRLCAPGVALLRASSLTPAETKALDASLSKSCKAGSAEACAVSGELARAQQLREKRFTAEPASERGLAALIAWASVAPVPDEALAPLDKPLFEALRYCLTHHQRRDCDPMLDQPAIMSRFGERLENAH